MMRSMPVPLIVSPLNTMYRWNVSEREHVVTDVHVKRGQERPCLIGDNGFLKIVSGELADRIQRVPPANDNDLYGLRHLTLEEHGIHVAVDLAQNWQHFLLQVLDVGGSLCESRLCRPEPRDHRAAPTPVA